MSQPAKRVEASSKWRLFNPSQFTAPKSPGEMSVDEWMKTQDPKFHGSFRSDFGDAPVAHYGTMGQAVERLRSVEHVLKGSTRGRDSYYNPGDGDYDYDSEVDETPMTHTGRVYARRFTKRPSGKPLTDAAANAAELGYRYENYEDEWEIPKSVRESAGTAAPELSFDAKYDNPTAIHHDKTAAHGQRMLAAGRPIKYHNVIEGHNPIDAVANPFSYIAPRSAVTSWERDVLNEPRASRMSQQFAQQRIEQGREGAVAFPSPTVTRPPSQQQLPIYYDENERASGTSGATSRRWMQYTGGVEKDPPAKRSILQEIQFEA